MQVLDKLMFCKAWDEAVFAHVMKGCLPCLVVSVTVFEKLQPV